MTSKPLTVKQLHKDARWPGFKPQVSLNNLRPFRSGLVASDGYHLYWYYQAPDWKEYQNVHANYWLGRKNWPYYPSYVVDRVRDKYLVKDDKLWMALSTDSRHEIYRRTMIENGLPERSPKLWKNEYMWPCGTYHAFEGEYPEIEKIMFPDKMSNYNKFDVLLKDIRRACNSGLKVMTLMLGTNRMKDLEIKQVHHALLLHDRLTVNFEVPPLREAVQFETRAKRVYLMPMQIKKSVETYKVYAVHDVEEVFRVQEKNTI